MQDFSKNNPLLKMVSNWAIWMNIWTKNVQSLGYQKKNLKSIKRDVNGYSAKD